MKALLAIVCVLPLAFGGGRPASGAASRVEADLEPAAQEPVPMQFEAFDVFVDSGDAALGAWQFEWLVQAGKASIVGVEGGDGVFAAAPYYDAAALQGGRILVAAFSTAEALPRGRTRVARVHMQSEGGAKFAVRLQASADGKGEALAAEITWKKMESK